MIPHHDLDAATNEIWERILRVNVLGTWNVIHAAAPHLRASGDGVILNITSVAGVRPLGSSIPYAVSKAALNHLTVLLANVLGPEIRVHAVAPGLIDTPWTDGWDDVRAAVQERAPLRRSGTPEDVADACVALDRRSLRDGAGPRRRRRSRADMTTTTNDTSTFDRDDPPILGANPFIGLTRGQVAAALARVAQRVAVEPGVAAAAWAETVGELLRVAVGRSNVAPAKGDRRFTDPAWQQNPLFRRIMQGYLVENQAAHRVIDEVELDAKSRTRAHFACRC